MPDESRRIALADIEPRIPGPGGQRFAVAFARGSLSVELYIPRGFDPQQPHDRDEPYVVVRGRGELVSGNSRQPFGPGDALFAPAGVPHRFEGFTDDFATWVMFYGPRGGEQPAKA